MTLVTNKNSPRQCANTEEGSIAGAMLKNHLHSNMESRQNGRILMEILNIQEDMKIVMHSPVEGFAGTPLGEVFDSYIKRFGACNIHIICSLVYNLGKMHGKREERARRKGAKQYDREV